MKIKTLIAGFFASTLLITGTVNAASFSDEDKAMMKDNMNSAMEESLKYINETMTEPQNFVVEMLNKNPDNKRDTMVFSQPVIFANPGDTITFVPTDRGHNSEIIKDFHPEGAEGWKGAINEEITVTLAKEGVYGYKCTPHASMGMFGIIIVGNPDTIEVPEDVKIRGKKSKDRIEAYIEDANSIHAESMSHE